MILRDIRKGDFGVQVKYSSKVANKKIVKTCARIRE